MLAALLFVVVDLFVLGNPDLGSVIAASLVMMLWYIGRRLRFRGEYLRLLEERATHLEQQKTAPPTSMQQPSPSWRSFKWAKHKKPGNNSSKFSRLPKAMKI